MSNREDDARAAPAAPADPPRFALTPAGAITDWLDYQSKIRMSICKQAIKSLYVEGEGFDCTPDGLYMFIQLLDMRAKEMTWSEDQMGVMQIPDDFKDPDEYSYFLDYYGKIELETIQEWEQTYCKLRCRAAQDTVMLYQCIMNLLSDEGKAKVLIWKDEYQIEGYELGIALAKVVIRESHLDTNATVSTIRTQLSSLDKFILTIGSDITKFNQHVKLLVTSLPARKEETKDLLIYLFKAYVAVQDQVFVRYIEDKRTEYENGKEMSPDKLMELANNKYKNLKLAGKWNAPSPTEEKIVALESKISKMLKAQKSWKKEAKEKPKVLFKNNDKGEKPLWLKKHTPPEDHCLSKPRKWGVTPWYWCTKETGGKCGGKWRVHKPSECKGLKRKSDKEKPKHNKKDTKKKRSGPPKMKLAEAYQTIMEAQRASDKSDDKSVSSEGS